MKRRDTEPSARTRSARSGSSSYSSCSRSTGGERNGVGELVALIGDCTLLTLYSDLSEAGERRTHEAGFALAPNLMHPQRIFFTSAETVASTRGRMRAFSAPGAASLPDSGSPMNVRRIDPSVRPTSTASASRREPGIGGPNRVRSLSRVPAHGVAVATGRRIAAIRNSTDAQVGARALYTLRRRFVTGKISTEEYERRKKLLERNTYSSPPMRYAH